MSRAWSGGSTRQWRTVRALVLHRDGHLCQVPRGARPCGAPATSVDHIIPRSLGGSDDPSNLRECATFRDLLAAAGGA
jgi:5-methylcytosine-specific restriction protein A